MVDETKAFLNAQLSQGGAHAEGRDPVDAVVRLRARWRRSTASPRRRRRRPGRRWIRRSGSGIFTQPARDRLALGPDDDPPRQARRVLHAQGDVHAARRSRRAGVDTSDPAHRRRTERQRIESVTPRPASAAACHAFINPFGFMQENFDAIGRWRTTDNGLPDRRRASRSTSSTRGRSRASIAGRRAQAASPARCASSSASSRQLFRFYTGRDETAATIRCCARCSSSSPTTTSRTSSSCCARWRRSTELLAARGGAMRAQAQGQDSPGAI